MEKPTRRRIVLIAIAVLVVLAVVYTFLPDPIPVDAAAVTRGPFQVVVEEEGETRIEDRYVVTSPVMAYARRIALVEGDIVERGQVLVQLEAPRTSMLDPRTQAEAEARVRAAAAAVEDATVLVERTAADADRAEALMEAGAIAARDVEEARAAAIRANAALSVARAELTAAQAAARRPGEGGEAPEPLRAPAAGRVLSVARKSEGPVTPGEPLLEIGDTRRLEVHADVLSQDAVRIQPGMRVVIDDWGGETPLDAVVTRVEPQGVTRVSALGVEEQRVPVRADLTSPPALWEDLGSGYRVLARFIVREAAAVLQVPTSALFRTETGWAVFVVDGDRATLRDIGVGQQAGLTAEILEGLTEGDRVVVHPSNDLEDGSRIRIRDGDEAADG